jgi:hypothetical protein
MGFFSATDGTRLYYQDWGSGQAVVFLHSWHLARGTIPASSGRSFARRACRNWPSSRRMLTTSLSASGGSPTWHSRYHVPPGRA